MSKTNDSQNHDSKTKISIIIPVWPEEKRPFGLDYIDKLDWPENELEIILSHGLQPCKQRNEAAKLTKGEILVFLDNDSCPEPDYLQKTVGHFNNLEVAGVGGPNPAVPTKKFIPQLVDAVFTSRAAVMSKIARYKPTGSIRSGTDSDFIFCNFALRKEIYLEMNGLDERLCPNEENEFFERFFHKYPDKKLIYDPEIIAREPRPETICFFLKKIFGYGRGRSRQFKISPSIWGFLHILGCFSLLLPVVILLIWKIPGLLCLIIPYVLWLFFGAIETLVNTKNPFLAIGISLFIFLTHLIYILGMWKGMFEKISPNLFSNCTVKIEYYAPKD